MRVLHEEASHEVVLVSQPGRKGRIGEQEETRVLDTAGGQDEYPGRHGEAGTPKTGDPRPRHVGAVPSRFQLHRRGVQIDGEVLGSGQIVPIHAAKPRGWLAELEDRRGDAVTSEGQGRPRGRLVPGLWRTRSGRAVRLEGADLAVAVAQLLEDLVAVLAEEGRRRDRRR